VVFSSTIDKVDWYTRLVTGGATLAGAAMRAGLIDEYALARSWWAAALRSSRHWIAGRT